MRTVRFVLVGLGNLGRRFCEIAVEKAPLLRDGYGLELVMVGAADSRGAAYASDGLDMREVARIKRKGGSIADYGNAGRTGWGAVELVGAADADLLLEASPVNLEEGAEPGLSAIRLAMQKGMHVVTPNKGPLVVAFRELHELARKHHVQLRYDGTVAGGLPALYVGGRDLRGAEVLGMEAVPNLVTGYIMDMLAEGVTWKDATARAREEGVLEADAAWDLDGWDAAAKLVILANTVLGLDVKLDDVDRRGISDVSADDLRSAHEQDQRYRLLARAVLHEEGGGYDLSVAPTPLSERHPLGRLGQKQMGVVYATDIYGTITCIIDEPNPIPSSATMLRDLLDIYAEPGHGMRG